jgi:transcriptional regulator with XRE-family HTH domain
MRKQDPIDSYVGQRLKLRRTMLGLSQERLGDAVGVSFQMIQKYERGDCRVGASRLMKIAQTLQVPVSWFFEGQGQPVLSTGGENLLSEDRVILDDDVFQRKETLDLLRAYYALPDAVRKHVLGMVRGLEKEGEVKDDGEPPVSRVPQS